MNSISTLLDRQHDLIELERYFITIALIVTYLLPPVALPTFDARSPVGANLELLQHVLRYVLSQNRRWLGRPLLVTM